MKDKLNKLINSKGNIDLPKFSNEASAQHSALDNAIIQIPLDGWRDPGPSMMAILKGPEMILSSANDAILESWGKGKEVFGQSIWIILPEVKLQGLDKVLLEVYHTGTPFHAFEMPIHLNRNGVVKLMHYTFDYQAYRNKDNQIEGVLILANEVSEQIAARKSLAHNERIYENLIQVLPLAVYACDQLGYLQLYNKAAAELWGREPQIGIDRWCGSSEIFDLDGLPIALENCSMAVALKEGLPVLEQEAKIKRPDGTIRSVLTHPQLIRNENGVVTGAINTLIDVTEIRNSQQELLDQEIAFYHKNLETEQLRAKELEEKVRRRTLEVSLANEILLQKNREVEDAREKLYSEYARGLIEASLDPLITISTKGKITDMNAAMLTATDERRDRMINTDFEVYFTDPEKARKVYQEVFSKGYVKNYPLTIKDHKQTDVLFNGAVYKNEKGEVVGAVVVARDITEQKRIEKELTEAKVFAEMATLIAEDSKNKAEMATKTAEDAVKAKQQFLSNMSHEIRTPMNAIIGFTKVVMKTALTAKQKEYLAAIKTSGDSLIVLINDILDLAKVDAGKMTFEHTPFKIASSISTMLHLFETKVQEKNLQLLKEYDPKIPKVLVGDPVRLHQIMLNLVSNAIKFTHQGNITVSIRLVKEDENQAQLEFLIADTGIGIPKDKIESIFENFQQASSGTSRLFGGTGLGLAISKQLIEQQGGHIYVKSKVGEGSTFGFILDFQKTTDEAELDTALADIDSEIKNIKVLVVEDMALNQLLVKTVLDDFGFERDIAANGKIAIEQLKTKTYDVILMDLQMPEMNGFEATEYIRKVLHSKIPIIALTADVTTVDLEKCKAAGMDDYIAKPIDERLLYNKIVGLVMKPILNNSSKSSEISAGKRMKYTDLDFLMQRTKNNSEMMMEMISAYLEQTPSLVSAMKSSLEKQDWEALHAAAHKIIPSFAIMGMSADFEKMAQKIQEYARTQQEIDGISELVLQIETVCMQACTELEEEFNRFKKKNT